MDISERYLKVIQNSGKEYAKKLFRKLREYGYNSELMKLHFIGGGGCIIKHFGEYDKDSTTIVEDICATAKGYEYLSMQRALRKRKNN